MRINTPQGNWIAVIRDTMFDEEKKIKDYSKTDSLGISRT